MSKDAVFPSSTNYWYSLSCFPTTTRRRRHLSAGLPSHPPAYALRGLAHSRYFGTSLRFFGTDVPNSQHRNKSDSKKVPPHWLVISERTSPLAGNGRHAVNPLHAALNYAYALLDNACRSALNNMGSMLHADTCTLTSFTEIVWSMI